MFLIYLKLAYSFCRKDLQFFQSKNVALENYLTFVKMIGQSFDSIWVYIKSISDKTNTDNRLEYGAPSGIIADILRKVINNILSFC